MYSIKGFGSMVDPQWSAVEKLMGHELHVKKLIDSSLLPQIKAQQALLGMQNKFAEICPMREQSLYQRFRNNHIGIKP